MNDELPTHVDVPAETEPPGLGDRLRAAYHRIFDVPDYAAYVKHLREHHPDQEPLTEREFAAQYVDRRYGTKGPRCC